MLAREPPSSRRLHGVRWGLRAPRALALVSVCECEPPSVRRPAYRPHSLALCLGPRPVVCVGRVTVVSPPPVFALPPVSWAGRAAPACARALWTRRLLLRLLPWWAPVPGLAVSSWTPCLFSLGGRGALRLVDVCRRRATWLAVPRMRPRVLASLCHRGLVCPVCGRVRVACGLFSASALVPSRPPARMCRWGFAVCGALSMPFWLARSRLPVTPASSGGGGGGGGHCCLGSESVRALHLAQDGHEEPHPTIGSLSFPAVVPGSGPQQ